MRYESQSPLFDVYLPPDEVQHVVYRAPVVPSDEELFTAYHDIPDSQQPRSTPVYSAPPEPEPPTAWVLFVLIASAFFSGLSWLILTLLASAATPRYSTPDFGWVTWVCGFLFCTLNALPWWLYQNSKSAYPRRVEESKEAHAKALQAHAFHVSEIQQANAARQELIRQKKEELGPITNEQVNEAKLKFSGRLGMSRYIDSMELYRLGLRPKSPMEYLQAVEGGYVTAFEDDLGCDLSKYLPLERQVWVPIELVYPADFLAIQPFDGKVWVIEVDGANANDLEKDAIRTESLTAMGVGVIRVQNRAVKDHCELLARQIGEYTLFRQVLTLPSSCLSFHSNLSKLHVVLNPALATAKVKHTASITIPAKELAPVDYDALGTTCRTLGEMQTELLRLGYPSDLANREAANALVHILRKRRGR